MARQNLGFARARDDLGTSLPADEIGRADGEGPLSLEGDVTLDEGCLIPVSDPLADDGLVELIYDARANQAALAVRNSDGSIRLVPQDGQADSLVRRELILLPSEVGEPSCTSQLLDQVAAFIHTYVDLELRHERVAAAYVLMTWVFDRFSAVPYLRALGAIGTGKTRFLLTVGSLCYRAIFAGGAVSPAAIFRAVDLYGGTLIIDEGDFRAAGMWTEMIKVLNSGYHRGLPALRAEPKGGVRAYAVFGPKILASRHRFADDALESRCITVRLRTTAREDILLLLPQSFWEEALALRNRLLRFRLDNYATIEAPAVRVQRGFEPRVSQILGALQPFLGDDGLLDDLRAEMQSSLVDVRADGVEADIAELIVTKGGELLIKVIRKHLLDHGEELSEKKIGLILRTNLGLGEYMRRTREGVVLLPLPSERLDDLAVRYGVNGSREKPARGLWFLRRGVA